MKRTIIIALALTHIAGLISPSIVAAQGRLSLERRSLTQQTKAPGDDGTDEAAKGEFSYSPPSSLEGPIDPTTYILGPSDELIVIVRGPKTATHRLRVLPEGNILLPNVGTFHAAGLTLVECKDKVKELLRQYYPTIEIDMQLTIPRKFVVFVVGEVPQPGAVEVSAPSRVGRAIILAGGVNDGASLREIEILEDGKVVRKVDLYKFLQSGDFEENPYVKEGQSIRVPARRMKANIVGEVRRSGEFEILPGETAADLVAFARGFASTADSTRLILERIQPGDELTTHTIKGDEMTSFELKDLDVIVVPDLVSYHMIEPVEVFGGGGREGTFRIRENETLRDFLSRLWRFSYSFEIEQAVIERYVGEGQPEFIEFSVPDVLAGDSTGDFVLEPGDLISFPRRERNVYVTGEVNAPGPIPFQPGITAERYIAIAGGPNNIGTYDKIDIFGEDGRKRSGNRTSLIYRGETIVVKTRTSHQFGSIFSGLISITALAVAVIAVTK